MRLAAELGVPVVPRGSGTGLCGGAVPLDGAIVLSVARMNRILDVDPAVPCARVEPGVLNLDLSVAVRHLGLHYAPDPSSQQACSIGGNVATNAGGPHCLASGVTAQHVLGMEIVLGRRRGPAPGRHRPRPARLRPARLRGGRRGHARRGHRGDSCGSCAPRRRCARCCSTSPRCARRARPWAASSTPGVIPAAMEMMDRRMTRRRRGVRARRPAGRRGGDAAGRGRRHARPRSPSHTAVVERVGAEHRRAAGCAWPRDDAEARALLEGAQERVRRRRAGRPELLPPRLRGAAHPPGGGARGDRARSATRHDLVIMNVFHAGDGNLHPLIAFDRRDAEQVERVHAAGADDHRGLRRGGRRALGRARHRAGEARLHAAHVQRRGPRRPGPRARGLRPRGPHQPRQGAAPRAAAAASWCWTPGSLPPGTWL